MQSRQPLTARDKAMIRNLKETLRSKDDTLVPELEAMESMDSKAEIESLYKISGLCNFSAALAATLQQVVDEVQQIQ